MKRIRPISIILIALVIALSVTIFMMSSQESDESSETSGGVCEFLLKLFDSDFEELSNDEKAESIDNLQFIVRKAAHFSAYALICALTLCACLSLQFKALTSAVTAISYSLLFSISDEIHQSFVPGRSCEFRDVMIDLSGAVVGAMFILLVRKIIQKRFPK